jgi:sugar-specific transcriptional regulator TrmB
MTDDLLSHLHEIGFTEYEAKVYLALLREHPATGYRLGKVSGVPRSMVYEALGRLHARGVVLETVEEKATLYRPLPPGAFLERIKQDYQNVVEALEQGLEAIYQGDEEQHLWSVRGESSIRSYALRMIRSADHELMLVLSDRDLEELQDEIEARCEEGIEVFAVLTGEGTLRCGDIVRHPPKESELQELTDALVLVVDNREALISGGGPEPTATITSNHNLVLIARQFIWMELFAQRIVEHIGPDLMGRLTPEDQRVLQSFPLEPERRDE